VVSSTPSRLTSGGSIDSRGNWTGDAHKEKPRLHQPRDVRRRREAVARLHARCSGPV